MSGSLYVFNPDNDLALANGDANYVPSRQARKMAFDLALLPAWYAGEHSSVLVPSPDIVPELLVKMLPDVRIVEKEQLAGDDFTGINPWGWNPMLVKYLRTCGVSETLLPAGQQIKRIREYSHRSFAVGLLKELAGSDYLCGSAECIDSIPEINFFVEQAPVALLKAPWSGSGKGLFWTDGSYTYLMDRWVRNVLEKQQCVVAETVYDKVEDFAMEFYSDGNGKVRFAGYSLFWTDKRGAYKQNLLATDECIQDRLSKFVLTDVLLLVREKLEKCLSPSVGTCYKGYLGVDMMVCRFPEKPFYRIHPCVELNLRMNMGMVSRIFYDRLVLCGKQGYFFVDYFKNPADLHQKHRENSAAFPLIEKNGKIVSGYLPLTSIMENTQYISGIQLF